MEWQPPKDQVFEGAAKQEVQRSAQDQGFIFGQPKPAEVIPVVDTTPTLDRGPVRTWSPTLWDTFSKCKYAVFLRRVKKIKSPGNKFTERGNKIHDKAERYVNGDLKRLPTELKKFKSRFLDLRQAYEDGLVHLEEDWIFDPEWVPVEINDPNKWGWFKLDVFKWDDKDKKGGTVIDHKSGKKIGNEAKHGFQGLCYAIAAFMRFPELQFVRVEFWYVDHGDTLIKTYTREECTSVFLKRITDRGVKITTEKDFIPAPSASNCRFCNYKDTEDCEWAVFEDAPSKKYESVKQRAKS